MIQVTEFADSKLSQRPSFYLNGIMMLGVSALGFIGLKLFSNQQQLALLGWSSLLVLGFVGSWRWFWFGLAVVRSRIYLYLVFARWRRRANTVPSDDLPSVCIVVATFKEKPWITERVFRAIAQEAKSLTKPTTVVVVTTEQEIIDIQEIFKSEDPNFSSIHMVPVVDPGGGKRQALAVGLREATRLNLPEDTIVALMDGDAVLSPGSLRKCLPFFLMFPKMGALTTDEMPLVVGSHLFSEWLHLRFCQRHLYMCSHALSRKLLCLTGRFSLFRSEAALDSTFADLLEADTLKDWLWGEFKFLSGDDKSTWYWMLRRGYDLLYIPDVMVYTIETISGSVADRAYQNMRRWSGNMLRNGNRAVALGPKKIGWFIWYSLLDQRLSIWTSLIAPGLLLIYLFQSNWGAMAVILSWMLFSRPLTLIIMFWGRESQLKLIHLPILLIGQWGGSLIKIWTQMNLAQQKWKNRGNQSRSAGGSVWERQIKNSTSRFLIISQLFSFVVFLLSLSKVLNPIQDLPEELGWSHQVVAQPALTQIIEAVDHGIVPNDGQDDSAPLRALINQLPSQGRVQINLPIGEIDLFQPVEINRSHTVLKGQGIGRTILQARFNRKVAEAVLLIRPRLSKAFLSEPPTAKISKVKVEDVQLSSFTLLHILPKTEATVNGIVLENVVHSQIKNLDLEKSGRHPLLLRKTQDVKVEYVSMD
jgi:glycosyltransferase Alg8